MKQLISIDGSTLGVFSHVEDKGDYYIADGVKVQKDFNPTLTAVPDGYTLPVMPSLEGYEEDAQLYLDEAAQSLGYDDIKSAVGYADEPSVAVFQHQGKQLRRLRSLVWQRCYQLRDEVLGGQRPPPAIGKEFRSLLPKLEDMVVD
jgi:hypothetical protein